jgi:hypothetical protein
MARLEDLTVGARARGVLPDRAVTVVQAAWHGSAAIALTVTTTGMPATSFSTRRRVGPLTFGSRRGRRRSRSGRGSPSTVAERRRPWRARRYDKKAWRAKDSEYPLLVLR